MSEKIVYVSCLESFEKEFLSNLLDYEDKNGVSLKNLLYNDEIGKVFASFFDKAFQVSKELFITHFSQLFISSPAIRVSGLGDLIYSMRSDWITVTQELLSVHAKWCEHVNFKKEFDLIKVACIEAFVTQRKGTGHHEIVLLNRAQNNFYTLAEKVTAMREKKIIDVNNLDCDEQSVKASSKKKVTKSKTK